MNKSNSKSKNKKPAILQILPELESGGVERGTIEIARALVKEGFPSYVASCGGSLTSSVNNAGATHITLPLKSKNPLTILLNINKIAKVINKYDIDIIHARSRAPAWSAYFAAKKTGKKFITTFHGTYSCPNKLKKLYNSVMLKGEKIIAISDFIKKHIIENYNVDKKKITIIFRGVDLEDFNINKISKERLIQLSEKLQIETDTPIIMLPGRVTGWKGHDLLIEALKKLQNKNFTCLMVGRSSPNDTFRKKIEQKIKDYGLTHKIRFIGNIIDMPALYSLANIIISASTRPEAFGRVAVEAQAMERLIIATKHGGSCETIIDRETGWLVSPFDPKELADKILYALTITSAERKKITKKAKQHIIDNYSTNIMIKKTLNLYKKLTNE